MNKILKIYNFIKERLSKDGYQLDMDQISNVKLTERVGFRLSKDEKILYEKYCSLRGVNFTTFMRIAAHNEVGRFIIETDSDTKYYNSQKVS